MLRQRMIPVDNSAKIVGKAEVRLVIDQINRLRQKGKIHASALQHIVDRILRIFHQVEMNVGISVIKIGDEFQREILRNTVCRGNVQGGKRIDALLGKFAFDAAALAENDIGSRVQLMGIDGRMKPLRRTGEKAASQLFL